MRYTPDEIIQFLWCPTITNKSAPTAAQIAAGTDFTGIIQAAPEMTFAATSIESPDYGSRFTKKFEGRYSVEDLTFVLYKGDAVADPEEVFGALMIQGADGFLVRIHPVNQAKGSKIAGGKAEVWPVSVLVSSVNNPPPGEQVKRTVTFTVTDTPVLPATIAA